MSQATLVSFAVNPATARIPFTYESHEPIDFTSIKKDEIFWYNSAYYHVIDTNEVSLICNSYVLVGDTLVLSRKNVFLDKSQNYWTVVLKAVKEKKSLFWG